MQDQTIKLIKLSWNEFVSLFIFVVFVVILWWNYVVIKEKNKYVNVNHVRSFLLYAFLKKIIW